MGQTQGEGLCLHGASLRGAQLFEELGIANRWGADGGGQVIGNGRGCS